MADKARHAFGSTQNLSAAISSSAIDAFDILFLDGETSPKIGWQDKNNVTRIVDTEKVVVVEGESLPATGVAGKIYIHNENCFFWNGTAFKPVSKEADISGLTTQVTNLETQMKTKVDETTVENMIKEYSESVVEVVEF